MKWLFRLIKNLLILFLLFCLAFYSVVFYQLSKNPHDNLDYDDPDLTYVINWLGTENYKILHSYHPTGNWSGDYTKLFLIEYKENINIIDKGITIGDQLNDEQTRAVEFIMDLTDDKETPWFPKKEQVMSNKYYSYFIKRKYHGNYPDSVHVVFLNPQAKRVIFAAIKI